MRRILRLVFGLKLKIGKVNWVHAKAQYTSIVMIGPKNIMALFQDHYGKPGPAGRRSIGGKRTCSKLNKENENPEKSFLGSIVSSQSSPKLTHSEPAHPVPSAILVDHCHDNCAPSSHDGGSER